MFKVEKGIPAPLGNARKYPFLEMEVGDSFLVPTTHKEHENRQSTLSTLGRYHGKGKKLFITSYVKKERGIRVWRTK